MTTRPGKFASTAFALMFMLVLGAATILTSRSASSQAAELPGDAALREKNLRTIQTFFKTMSPDVDALFTDDATKEITFATFTSKDETPWTWVGKEEIRKNFKMNDQRFAGWNWEHVKISQTQDPNVFWVEADGVGKLTLKGETRTYTQKNFFCSFDMKDGKIARYREIMNPLELIKSIGGKVVLPPGFTTPKY